MKNCTYCEFGMPQRSDESDGQYQKRLFHDQTCATAYHNAVRRGDDPKAVLRDIRLRSHVAGMNLGMDVSERPANRWAV